MITTYKGMQDQEPVVKYNMYVSAGGMILQIIADLIFIPIYGTMAVAIANVIIYLLMAICLYIVFKQKYLMVAE